MSSESKSVEILGEKYEVMKVPEPPPESKSFMSRWKLVGPGWVMMAQEVGTGELITGAFIGAKGYFGAAWAGLVSACVKIVNDYLHARYTLYTGEHPTRRYWRTWAGLPLWILLIQVMILFPVTGLAGLSGSLTSAVMALFNIKDVWPWYYVLMVVNAFLIWVVIWFPKYVYRIIEVIAMVMYVILYSGTLITAALVSTPTTVRDFFIGLVSFGYIPPVLGLWTVLSWMGWGFGGDYNEPLRYPMWFTERGWGMTYYKLEARKISGIVARGEGGERSEMMERLGKGWLFDYTNPTEFEKMRLWNKVLIQDLIGIYLPLALYGCFIFMYLAGCILHPRGLAPSGFAVVTAQAEFFRVWLGDFGWYFFIFLSILVLYPTVLGAWDGTSRYLADAILGFKKTLQKRFYIFVAIVAIGIIILPFITTPTAAICASLTMIVWIIAYALAVYRFNSFRAIYHMFVIACGAAVLIMMWAAAPLWFVLLGSAIAVSLLPVGQSVILYTWLKMPKELRPKTILLIWQALAITFWVIFTILSWLNLFGIYKL
ncbi:MAG: Nramp family divalent metal transporter [Sulfolobales archaeon]